MTYPCLRFWIPEGARGSQPCTRPGKPGFDSCLGYLKRLGDLSHRPGLLHLHLDDLTQPGLELSDGGKHSSVALAVKTDMFRARTCISELEA